MRTLRGPRVGGTGGGAGPGFVVVGATVLAVLVGRLYRLRNGGRPREVVEASYDAMLRALARRGFVRRPAMTPREFAASLPLPVRPAAARITRLFEAFRYRHRPADAQVTTTSRQALGELLDVARRARIGSTGSRRPSST